MQQAPRAGYAEAGPISTSVSCASPRALAPPQPHTRALCAVGSGRARSRPLPEALCDDSLGIALVLALFPLLLLLVALLAHAHARPQHTRPQHARKKERGRRASAAAKEAATFGDVPAAPQTRTRTFCSFMRATLSSSVAGASCSSLSSGTWASAPAPAQGASCAAPAPSATSSSATIAARGWWCAAQRVRGTQCPATS